MAKIHAPIKLSLWMPHRVMIDAQALAHVLAPALRARLGAVLKGESTEDGVGGDY